MGIKPPVYGYEIGDVNDLLKDDKLNKLKSLIDESKKETITGIIGGPPCPDFSIAGHNKGENGENGRLSKTYTELICSTHPDFFLFENVKGLYRTAKHREFFERMKKTFVDNGYFLTEQLVNAIEYGVPQDRYRIILIGFSKECVKRLNLPFEGDELKDFPWEKHKKYPKSVLESLPWPNKDTYEENGFREKPDGIIDELTVQYWWDKNDVENHPNGEMYFQPRQGLSKFQSFEEGDCKRKSGKRLHRWRYSPTAAYGNNEVHIHPYKSRRISVAESLAIQSLPKEFVIPPTVTLSNAFKTIGNGVPFLLAKGIAESIFDYINNSK
jgi:DNA (cytosine-5)-methyltransferase 1